MNSSVIKKEKRERREKGERKESRAIIIK